ncbi:ABC-2 transporter permease [Amycolatopsis sp. NPDC051903]|uniref:ABC-2 transporter permease n=1 Tax=Amycolatopsis sp. NPDC051903 TaxID=3363936 RepID=UPI0037947582
MTGIARMALLDLRTVAPYRNQGLLLFGLVVLIDVKSPHVLVPALVLLVTSQVAAYPFTVADKAGLETLYAVLPLPRRTVLYGHYAWALATFLGTASAGTALALLLSRVQAAPLDGRTLLTMLSASWALFALNVAIQFPLFIRFGYSRISVLATTLPLALVMLAFVRLHPDIASVRIWLPALWVAGAAAIVASAAVAQTADRRHLRRPRRRP